MLPLEGSLRGLRESLFLRCDISPTPDPRSVLAANNFINQAVQQIAIEIPAAFHEETTKFLALPEFKSDPVATDTVTLIQGNNFSGDAPDSLNLFVFQRDTLEASAETPWPFDRSYDTASVQITDATGFVHTNQIRSIWVDTSSGRGYFSLVYPFDPYDAEGASTRGPFKYRIFHPYLWIPDDVIQIKSLRVVGEVAPNRIEVISQDQAERTGIADHSFIADAANVPRVAYRRGHHQLAPLHTPPRVSLSTEEADDWIGPESFGEFEYAVTLCAGKRWWSHTPGVMPNIDAMQRKPFTRDRLNTYDTLDWADARMGEPIFESAPSPASAKITVSDTGLATHAKAILVEVPNYQYQLGFMFSGNFRDGASPVQAFSAGDVQSGVYARIYRKRLSDDRGFGYSQLGSGSLDGQNVGGFLDLPDTHLLLAEFRPDANNAGVFIDNGSITPDYTRRLRNIHGYQAFRLYPLPDKRTEIEARIVKRPALLLDDNDVCPIDPVATKVVVDYAAILMYERMGAWVASRESRRSYMESRAKIVQRYTDLRPAEQVMKRYPTRVRGWNAPGRWWFNQ